MTFKEFLNESSKQEKIADAVQKGLSGFGVQTIRGKDYYKNPTLQSRMVIATITKDRIKIEDDNNRGPDASFYHDEVKDAVDVIRRRLGNL